MFLYLGQVTPEKKSSFPYLVITSVNFGLWTKNLKHRFLKQQIKGSKTCNISYLFASLTEGGNSSISAGILHLETKVNG